MHLIELETTNQIGLRPEVANPIQEARETNRPWRKEFRASIKREKAIWENITLTTFFMMFAGLILFGLLTLVFPQIPSPLVLLTYIPLIGWIGSYVKIHNLMILLEKLSGPEDN